MKSHYRFICFVIFIFAIIFITKKSEANWQKSENKNSGVSRDVTSQNIKTDKSDTLPNGVTQSWLNSLTDENGDRIISKQNKSIQEEPGLDAMQQNNFNGYASGNHFGNSVSSAGDVNGDGFEDLIIGAFQFDTAGVQTGKAYIYLGGAVINSTADVILNGESFYNTFGISVSKAGDVNNDGFDDVIVGTRTFTATGKAFIYYGGSSMDNVADVIIEHTSVSDDAFGSCVSDGGDINNDGYDDVIVGSYGNVFVYLGSSFMDNTADFILTGENSTDGFGQAVSKAGDVNGDGFSDLIIGAFGYNSNRGKAYIYFGGIALDNIFDVEINRSDSGYYFATSVSEAGDVNGDGFGDVIVSASGYNSSMGRAYVYFGSANMNNIPDVTLTGENTNDVFGCSVSTAGDVNGDGFSDIIVGANNYNSYRGKSYVYYGGVNMNSTSDLFVTGENAADYLGYSVGACDMNGDGYSDFIAGAEGFNSGTGRVYINTNTMAGTDIADVSMIGEPGNNGFGQSVSDAGDVNGDGYSDVIVGAWGYDNSRGRAYIYFGGINMDNVADLIMTGEAINNWFGASVSGAGDVNGDGYADVIVGAYQYNNYAGRAYIYYGGSSMNNTADVIMTGTTSSYFGVSVSKAGDVNGDGYSDVIVGAWQYNLGTGRAYIYFGGISMNNTADVIMTGEAASYFAQSVSDAGDVNGDGYSDVIVGAYYYNSFLGRAYIYYGGSSMNNIADVVMTGSIPNSAFGISVSGAGDVNGDNYSDVIVGAHNSDSGNAYIFYGGSAMNNFYDVVFLGEGYVSGFGGSVSDAGDVNADGYSDVIIGSRNAASIKGKSYLYFGGKSMDHVTDISSMGENPSDYFGSSVSGAGDVNGDGIEDIITSASGYSSSRGKAYIYFSSPTSVKPVLNNVKDVPNDEGHFVNLKWARSGYDVPNINTISDYVVYRSTPPNALFYNWVERTVINSSNQSFYYYTDNTPTDSTADSSSRYYYRIKARNNVTGEFWYSEILNGNSYDNNAPEKVEPFTSEDESSDARLNWQRSTAPDFKNYLLYRSTASYIDPNIETVFQITTDTTFLDTSPLPGFYKYFIVAQDSNLHKSPLAIVENPFYKRTFLFGSIQGLYDPENDIEIYDTVTIYLRNGVAPYELVDSAKDILYGPLTGQDFLFENAENNIPYYIAVKHRNALETWSADPISMVIGENTIAFSVNSIYAYGNNEIQVDASPYNVFAFYSGDVNQDGYIDLTDVLAIYNGANNFLTGYVVTDLTGDSIVDLTDILMAYNNSAKFVSVIRP